MAVYGIPSTKKVYLVAYYASAIRKKGASVGMSLLANPNPDTELTNFLVKHTQGLVTDGTNYIRHVFNPPFSMDGPAILKMQASSDAANTDVSAGFDLILEDV